MRRLDYAGAEGLSGTQEHELKEESWRAWMLFGIAATGLVALIAVIFGVVAIAEMGTESRPVAAATTPAAGASAATAPTLADAQGMSYESFRPVDPTLPVVPPGAVKKFTVGVMQHITQVDPKLAPVQAWTYTVNGTAYRGTAASPPIVVDQGDRVQITFVNGASKAMGVDMSHSIDFHAAQVAPNKYYVDIAPGKAETFSFTAKHAGVFMYHCATQPVLTHTGTGMTGMMLVKPHDLPSVAKELWITQQEFYIGHPGGIADQAKLNAETPDVVAFNGYANQYKFDPIDVPVNKPVRIFVLNTGPSRWSAFHVIGTVFDTTDVEGVIGHDSQTISLAPSQGGWVQFSLDEAGNYPFVTHAFGDMVKGAAGILHTPGAPPPKGAPPAPTGGSSQPVLPAMVAGMAQQGAMSSAGMASSTGTGQAESVSSSKSGVVAALAGAVKTTMGDMWIRSTTNSHKAGKVTFAVSNQGRWRTGLRSRKRRSRSIRAERLRRAASSPSRLN
jgi:FtsP/CotA-like multicopper oxidase with cupredoxin domain